MYLYRVNRRMDWRGACKVLLYNGTGDECECSNSRTISLLSVVSKLHGRVLIKVVLKCACDSVR